MVLLWCVKLGKINITSGSLYTDQFQAFPRDGNLMVLGHIFSYLKRHQCSILMFDITQLDFTNRYFKKVDWLCFYLDTYKDIISNVIEPQGKGVIINMLVMLVMLNISQNGAPQKLHYLKCLWTDHLVIQES